MKRRNFSAVAALVGVVLLAVLAYTALAVGITPAGAAAVPQATHPPAVATNIAEHHAFEATLEARERAGAAIAPTPDPRNRPTVPASCPRKVPAQSLISLPQVQDPGARDLRISTQADVVVGPDEYALSSGGRKDNPQQGAIVVTQFASNPCVPSSPRTTVGEYAMPTAHGAITLTAVHGELVDFTTADGTTGHFNLVTKQFS
jgi:hypothetical protein